MNHSLIVDMTRDGSDGWSVPYEAKSWRFLNIEIHDIEDWNSSWVAGCLTIAAGGPCLKGSLVISFLLGRNLVIPKNKLRYIPCIGMSTFPCGIVPPWLRGRDRHIILVFTWEDRMEDWVIIWHSILFENVLGHSNKSSRESILFEG